MDAAEKIFSGEFDDDVDDDGDAEMHSVSVAERTTAPSVHMAVKVSITFVRIVAFTFMVSVCRHLLCRLRTRSRRKSPLAAIRMMIMTRRVVVMGTRMTTITNPTTSKHTKQKLARRLLKAIHMRVCSDL